MTLSAEDRRWLAAAARMARPFVGTTGRNPTVGALVVDPKTGEVLGRGVTAPGGKPHAEPIALDMAREKARGATLYVTLEPCFHHGATPPCADAVLAAGIARMVVTMPDPDPRTAGQSLEKLRDAGVEVALSAANDWPTWLHEGYLKRVTAGRPFVSAKLAVSADGMIGRRGTPNSPITSKAARRYTHALRARHDAIVIGAETARADDPALTVRLQGLEDRSPFRWVMLGTRPADPAWRVFSDGGPAAGVISPNATLAEALPQSAERLVVPPSADGTTNWTDVFAELVLRRVNQILVEGGAALLASLLAARLVDRFHLLESDVTVGEGGVPASPTGTIRDAITGAGLSQTGAHALGNDRLTVFERLD